ncbi:MAG: hypothetical protein ACK4KT_01355 [Thermaurantimonas sp.]
MKSLWFSWLAFTAAIDSYAQGDSLTFQKKANKLITYSVAANVATLGQTLFYSEENFQSRNFSPAFFLTNSLQHLPNLSQGKGFGLLGLQAAVTAGFYVTKNTQTEPPNFYNRMLFVPAYNVSLFASYTAYRDLRLRHLGASDSWQPYKVYELLLAPYYKETIKKPLCLGKRVRSDRHQPAF